MTIDATPGSPTANSYLTIAEADAIADEQGLGRAAPAWLDPTTLLADKERALVRATNEIDAFIGYTGQRYDPDQALLFPRYYDQTAGVATINANVRLATFWQAAHVLANANQIDDADTRRARGLISFSDDDGSGSVVSVKPEFGMIASKALGYLNAVRSSGRASLRSVPIASTYRRDAPL